MIIWTPQISKEMVVDAVRAEKEIRPKGNTPFDPGAAS